jgi:hypothetical protein
MLFVTIEKPVEKEEGDYEDLIKFTLKVQEALQMRRHWLRPWTFSPSSRHLLVSFCSSRIPSLCDPDELAHPRKK